MIALFEGLLTLARSYGPQSKAGYKEVIELLSKCWSEISDF